MKFIKANKPVSTTHKTLGEIKVDVEVPQVESEEEAVAFCGGPEGFLNFFNGAIETSAKNGGRAALRNAPAEANMAELVEKVVQLVRGYTPEASATRGPSKAAKAETFDAIANLVQSGQEFTKEQLLALLAGAK